MDKNYLNYNKAYKFRLKDNILVYTLMHMVKFYMSLNWEFYIERINSNKKILFMFNKKA
jgi:hypothetical protein